MTMITLTTTCPFCGCKNSVSVYEKDYIAWQNGTLIQDAFPYLLDDKREMLSSGICPSCWEDNCFFEDDEEYEDNYDECGFNPYMGGYDYDC